MKWLVISYGNLCFHLPSFTITLSHTYTHTSRMIINININANMSVNKAFTKRESGMKYHCEGGIKFFFSHLKDCHFRSTIFYHFCYFILNHKPFEFKRNKLDFVKISLARCFTLAIIIIVSSRYSSLQNFGLKIDHLNFK